MTAIVFYSFAFWAILFSLFTITARNPVYSVLSLIMVFFNIAAEFILIGAEFLAATLVIVYVGAVAVLFLFVVMMLDIKSESFSKRFSGSLPFAIFIATVLIMDLVLLHNFSTAEALKLNIFYVPNLKEEISNIHQIGSVLYTNYVLAFQVSGLILFVAMIGAILLTHRSRANVKRQDICLQNARNKESGVKLINVNVGAGVDVVK